MFFDELGAAGAGGSTGVSPTPTDSGVSGASPTPGGVGASPTPSVQPPVEQLRREYEATKAERDQWNKLGSYNDVQTAHQTYTKVTSEVMSLGTRLGYSEAEVRQAMEQDLAGTLVTLRQMAQQAQQDPRYRQQEDIQKLVDTKLQQALTPFQQEREQRLDREAESRFDGVFDQSFKTSFPNGLPESNSKALNGLAWAMLIENPQDYQALRNGDASMVGKYFEEAKKTLLGIVTDFVDHDKKRIGGQRETHTERKSNPTKGRTFAEIAAALNDDSIPLDVALGR